MCMMGTHYRTWFCEGDRFDRLELLSSGDMWLWGGVVVAFGWSLWTYQTQAGSQPPVDRQPNPSVELPKLKHSVKSGE
jgi:hypothetical protein